MRAGTIKNFAGENRIWLLLALIFAVMGAAAPRFLTAYNLTAILKNVSLNALAATGFTLVMITGQLDLSIGTSLTLGGMMAIGLQPALGWGGSIAVALACGVAVGLANGLLVAKARVDSFIATLGTMTVTQGLVYKFSHGATVTVAAGAQGLGGWMEHAFLPLLTPRIAIALALVLAFEAIMKRTRPGRAFYLIGGNRATAWQAGLAVDRYVIGAFVISGVLSTLGGALFSISINSATTAMGTNSLMIIVAATIIGGTSMAGGSGSAVKTTVALVALAALINGLSARGAGWEVQRIASGAVLGAIILYDARLVLRRARSRGQRRELLEELQRQQNEIELAEPDPEEDEMADRNNSNSLAIVVVGCVACVAIVAIFAMYFLELSRHTLPPAVATLATAAAPAADTKSAEVAEAADPTAKLKSDDGQPLLLPVKEKAIPPRPANPEALPEDDPLHWYDMEYAGWGVKKLPMPKSPGDGPRGKKVIFIKMMDHPYHGAVSRGMQKVADAYGITFKTMVSNCDINIQSQQVDQAINERPDLVIIHPVDSKASVPLLKRLYDAGIPTIASNLLPVDEGFKYVLAWTGPDDWGQFRLLAADFAKRMNYEGSYCVVRHNPGTSPFFARTFAPVTELKKIAPKMKCLEMQTTELSAEKSMQVVSDWITHYGAELKGIVSADDSGAQVGINEAIKNARREEIIRVAAGNSKVGMDFINDGKLHSITYQSAEADGATPMKLAADWFSGKPIPPVRYLPIRIINKENVKEYMPAQW